MFPDNPTYVALAIIIMTGITYTVRVVPYILFDKKIKNKWIQSFLYYVPYAVLSAMTFPAIFYATESMLASIIGTGVAILAAIKTSNLLIVAVCASVATFIASVLVV